MKSYPFTQRPRRSLGFVGWSCLFSFVLVILSWHFIVFGEEADLASLFSAENLQYAKKFVVSLLGLDQPDPAFFSAIRWKEALGLTLETLKLSILAIGFAVIGMLFTVIPASRVSANGTLTLTRRWYGWVAYALLRGIYLFSRAIPELIWAMLIIFILKPGLLPGALALALHNFGILGKLGAEVIEDLDLRPIRSLASSGANKAQIFIYGVIPLVLPKFITFVLYRWEVIVRTTIVVGFVGAGGLGQQFKLSMSWFHYTDVALLLICYVVLVIAADFISEAMRKAAQ